MKHEYRYEFHSGDEILKNQNILSQMYDILDTQDFMGREDILKYLDESAVICCMTKDNSIVGFSWTTICKEEQIAELCWFVMDKDKSKGLEGKQLLNKTIEYCKSEGISSLKFNCAKQSWGRIKDEHKLLSKFGYTLDKYETDYDVSINI